MTQDPGQRQSWHTMPVSHVRAALATGSHGLGTAEAQARLRRHGPNELQKDPPTPAFVVLLHQFRSPVIYILLVATVVTILLGEYIDASVIGAALALDAVIGFIQESRAESSVRALMELVSPRARVVRDGQEWDIDSRELVIGDVVLLESGVKVPADLRLESVNNLHVDESLLTGESLAVTKQSEPIAETDAAIGDRRSMAFAGSIITTGRARGFVTATAMQTELGRIATHMRVQEDPETPLQRRMAQFARRIGIIVAVGSAGAFALGVAVGEDTTTMFTVAVALAVAAVPEGLPVAFTITLALGVRRMARRNAIVRRLPAVETLGSATLIGSDKTGTLTENRMTVREVWATPGSYRLHGSSLEPVNDATEVSAIAEHRPLYLTLLAGMLSNEAEVHRSSAGIESTGDPTEIALLVAGADLGIEPEDARNSYRIEVDFPFESERQFSASVRMHSGRRMVFVKGAPERVSGMCQSILGDEGPEPIDQATVNDAGQAMAGRGLRVLGMAYRELGDQEFDLRHPGDLVFLGLQGLVDPPRAGVREAIAGCREAGIRVVMITGDHAVTASSIARELGIGDPGAPAVTGKEIERMSDQELQRIVGSTSVYARAAPEHKLRIINALRRSGEVVAVTGDGVNDGPALRAADIGIAMGKGGTDVAREAADMVLTDDNFISIYSAVEEGRTTFDNVRKVTFFLVSTGVASIFLILASVGLQWPVPLVAVQLLWLNLVTSGLQDIALAFEPGEKGTLQRPPRARDEGVLSAILWERTIIAGLVMAAGTLYLFRSELNDSGSEEMARTVALTGMVLFQVMHVGNSRSERLSAFAKSPFTNPFLFIATFAAVAVHVGALYFPPSQFLLDVEPLSLVTWAEIVVVSLSVIVVVEAHKAIRGGASEWLGNQQEPAVTQIARHRR